MDLKLLVVQGKPEGKEIPVRVPRFIIGRSAECQLRPNSELISRHHCQIAVNGNQASIMDLGSSNGTIVNGERITEEVPIDDGDLVQVGPLGFQVLLVRDSVVETAVAAAAETVPVAAPVAATAAPAPLQAGKLGSKEAKHDDIEQWLLSDTKNALPDSGSGVYTGDTQLLNIEALTETTRDTPLADTPTPPEGVAQALVTPGDEVQLADGRKVKVGSAKQVIEKTREDTSRAASDILRRMMERRPGR
jgi:predicted component of type VI protein secretion system